MSELFEAIKRTPGNIVGGGVDLANLVLGALTGAGLKGFVEKPIGGSEQLNEMFGLKAPQSTTQALTETALGMINPTATAKGATLAALSVLPLMLGAKKGAKLASGPGAKQAGVIVPALAGGSTKGTVRQAKELIEAGNIEEAYQKFGIYADPSTAQLLKVLPDTGAQPNYASGKVVPTLSSRSRIDDSPSITSIPAPSREAKATLPDVLSHPALYKYVPTLADTRVDKTAGGRLVSGPGAGVFYAGAPSHIGVGYHTRPQDFVSTLLHEAQHNIQYIYDMPRGTSPQYMQNNAALAEIKAGLSSAKLKQADPHGHLAAQFTESLLPAYKRKAFEAYRNVPGESQAALVQRQFDLNDYSTHPYTLLKELGLTGTQERAPVALTPELQQLLDYLRRP